ncbi:3-hydroxyacyl-CoA dehydrogenase [Arthrobacter sp. 24S4-2]|uniref:3-hydroxyacyl-CoA dehydrogenase NAD-binding domain-containing protein n=1 Tax=Arthrobacter sp. 24S4-2 TaxID=2575374 RepID=UPI0010C79DF3|nr:3-hydroxyacyl-CoA dehydrogenase NAD-binding domain-containing protein [Arthrobacter sp. 24S4-2]QCO96781.1 3-hydroxyacyl-CoA dehydrogenase [Arthrobacter sp. 24S4-2]
MSYTDYRELAGLVPHETITHSRLREIQLPGAGTFALVTLDNLIDRKPTTLGPKSLIELGTLLGKLRERAESGEIAAVGITGKPGCLAAGADLSVLRTLKDPQMGRTMARLGHQVYAALAAIPVPTFAFINGTAMGGGLELTLAADYRTVSTAASGISLPEAFIGLVPGWGGVYRLPRLIGPANAVKIMIENPLSNNRALNGPEAFELGIADALFDQKAFLEDSLGWARKIITDDTGAIDGATTWRDRKASYDDADWDAAVARGRAFVEAKTAGATPAPGRVLDLLEQGRNLSREESSEAEVQALAELMQTGEFKDSVYAFLDLLQRRAKHPSGAPDRALARPVTKVGVVGAGLMASQLALLFARQLQIPVVMTDIDQSRADKGVAHVHAQVDKLLAKERITTDAATRIKELVTGTATKDAFADADFVIEAVFEELSVKKQVLAGIEAIVSPQCILATNTSSLSVADMASDLRHPERVIGFHFFNPVAAMPLLEIIQTPKTNDEVLATAFDLAQHLKKTPILVQDSTAFVVNRILLRLIGEITSAFDDGTPGHIADQSLQPMGLPMSPFKLLDLVGIPVAQHVTESLNAAFGDRFRISPNLQTLINNGIKTLQDQNHPETRSIPASTLELLRFGNTPSTSTQLLLCVQDALAQEIGLMLEEGVVAGPEDIDLCMILGAGWPLHLGGITPYLDRVGASERANGRKFHHAH